jgi:hypothetical protein
MHFPFEAQGASRTMIQGIIQAQPDMITDLIKTEKGEVITQELLLTYIKNSGIAVEKLLEIALEQGKLKGFKPTSCSFFGLSDSIRSASSKTDYTDTETNQRTFREKNQLRNVGMGRKVELRIRN